MTAQLALIESDRVSLSLSRLSNIILRDHKLAEEGVEKVDWGEEETQFLESTDHNNVRF